MFAIKQTAGCLHITDREQRAREAKWHVPCSAASQEHRYEKNQDAGALHLFDAYFFSLLME